MLEQLTFEFERSGEFRWRVRISLLLEVEAVCSDPRFKSIPLWFALDNASTAALVIESICFECIILLITKSADSSQLSSQTNYIHHTASLWPQILSHLHLYRGMGKYKDFKPLSIRQKITYCLFSER